MTKKEARIEALRICTADLSAASGSLDFQGEFSDKDEDKIRKEISKISESLYKQAVRLGGDFNSFTGYEHGKTINI